MSPKKNERAQKIAVVLAMHGTPAKDFPEEERAALFALRAQLKHTATDHSAIQDRHDILDAKMRRWPRSEHNDPFYVGSHELARRLRAETGWEVIVGFNEFCSPDMDEALDQAVAAASEKVIVITPMMTQGGGHSKGDIPAAIERARKRHPEIPIVYAWPFPVGDVAQFLSSQIDRFLTK